MRRSTIITNDIRIFTTGLRSAQKSLSWSIISSNSLGKKLWEDLTLNPLADIRDLMTRVKMFACLEDDIRHVERASGSSSKGEGSFKKQKSMVDRDDQVRQGINVIFK